MGESLEKPNILRARKIAIDYNFMPATKTQLEQFDLDDGDSVTKLCRKIDHTNAKFLVDPDVID